MDGQFKALKGNTNGMQIDLNMLSNDEDPPTIEIYIKITDQIVNCTKTPLLLMKQPIWIAIEHMLVVIFLLNNFFSKIYEDPQNQFPEILLRYISLSTKTFV